jgi:integrase
MNTIYRLELFFPDRELRLFELDVRKCEAYYLAARTRVTKTGRALAVDSHRCILAAAKTFLKWCMGRPRRWLENNPAAEVEGVGRRRHGKPQLRIDEARRWTAKAIELADSGEQGAVAALVALLMGMRAKEIVSMVARDLDDEGRLLWIPDSKTEAGRRTLQVPELLRPYLQRAVEKKGPEELVFGQHWRDWVRKSVRRVCVQAGVPSVTAHAMRGLHSTLALEHGASAHVVAASLGHTSISTTLQSYAKPEAVAGAKQRRVLTVLDGGASASSTVQP